MSWNESCGETLLAHILSQVSKERPTDIPLFLVATILDLTVLTALAFSSATWTKSGNDGRLPTIFDSF